MKSKQAEAALIRMVEEGFAEISDLPAGRFKVIVTGVESPQSPPEHLLVSATLFFLKGSGEPFCCGEPECHSRMFFSDDPRLGDYLRNRMHLEHRVTVQIKASAVYYKGIQFTAFGKRGGYIHCPCCGYRTLQGSPESGQICELCLWEDLDRAQADSPSSRQGHNRGLSLNEARDNFRRIGACHECYLSSARPPSPEEKDEVKHLRPPSTAP